MSEHKSKEHDDSSDVEFDIKEILPYIKKAAPIVLVLLIFIFSIYLRSMTAWLPITEDWAKNSIDQQVKNNIGAKIDEQFPNLPPQNRNKLINEKFNQFLKEQGDQYYSQVDQIAEMYRSRLQDETGQTYLVAIDPYHWYRLAKNVVEKGHVGDEVRDGKQWDTHMRAPFGQTASKEFHVYIEAYFHKILRLFNPDISLMTSAFYLPVLLASLAVIPAFFLARKRAGLIGGAIAGIIVAVHPTFLTRTMGGFADTDPYNVVLPLFIVWFFLEAFETKSIKKAVIFTLLSVATLLFYSTTWSGWWYIYIFIIATIIAYIGWYFVFNIIKNKKSIISSIKSKIFRKEMTIIGIFLGVSLVTLAFRMGSKLLYIFIKAPINIINMKAVAKTTIWPNVLTTVAELNAASPLQIINGIGGSTIFFISLLGLILSLRVKAKSSGLKESLYVVGAIIFYQAVLSKPNNLDSLTFLILAGLPIAGKFVYNLFMYTKEELKESLDIKYTLIIFIWCLGTLFGASRGVRFIMLLMPAFSIAVALFAGILYRMIAEFSVDKMNIDSRIVYPITAVLVVGLILFSPMGGQLISKGYQTAVNEIPSMNDAWYSALTHIKENSDEDAIIGSWWDFGHWFKAIGDRGVFFDGSSQGYPAAHWMGKTLLSENENISMGVLRYMACGRDNVYDNLTRDAGLDPVKSVEIINTIMLMNSKDAKEYLKQYNIEERILEDVMKYSHCKPPEVYLITSEDMVGKGGVWGHFGSWDFTRAQMYNKVHKMKDENKAKQFLMQQYNLSKDKAETIYYDIQTQDPNHWISGWPGFLTTGSSCARKEKDLFVCQASVNSGTLTALLNTTSMEVGVLTSANSAASPVSISYKDNETGSFVVKEYANPQLPYSFTIQTDNKGNYNMVLMDPLQAKGMFTRLFYQDGAGANYFEKEYDVRGIAGGRVIVWKVDWETYLNDLGEKYSI